MARIVRASLGSDYHFSQNTCRSAEDQRPTKKDQEARTLSTIMSLSVSDDQTVWPQKNAEFYNYDLGLCELAFAMEVDESAQHGSIMFYRTCNPVVTTPHPTFDIRQKTIFKYCRPKAERGSTEAKFDEQATYLPACP